MLGTPRAIYGEHPGMKDRSHLTGAVQMLPTPRANKIGGYASPNFSPTLEQKLLSTPTASQIYKPVREPSPSEANGTHGRCLVADVIDQSCPETGERGVLNPSFVEMMMGFEIEWTDLGH